MAQAQTRQLAIERHGAAGMMSQAAPRDRAPRLDAAAPCEPLPEPEVRSDTTPSDGELARCVAQGDREAAHRLVMRYQAMVRSFLRRLTGDEALADDLAQDTFVRMLKHADRFNPDYAMKTWLLTIARRLLINHVRRAKRRVTTGEFDYLGSDEPGPHDIAADEDERRSLRDRLHDAMQTLSDAQRQVVLLFHQQDMSIQEVAETMDMPLGTVKSHLHRARKAMRQCLEPPMEIATP